MIFTDEQWKIIKEASPHFKTARQEYIRNAPRYLTEQIMNIYESATGNSILNKDISCATCVLRIYQTVGKAYFSDLAEREKEENKDERNIQEGNEKPKSRNTKKKKGDSRDVEERVFKHSDS